MKYRTIIKALLGVGFLVAIGFELGIIPRAFDSRSFVEDGVIGADYWIIEVDGEPTERVRHGLLITKIPLALIQPGDRVLGLSETSYPSDEADLVLHRVTIEKGMNYRIAKDGEGNPELMLQE